MRRVARRGDRLVQLFPVSGDNNLGLRAHDDSEAQKATKMLAKLGCLAVTDLADGSPAAFKPSAAANGVLDVQKCDSSLPHATLGMMSKCHLDGLHKGLRPNWRRAVARLRSRPMLH